METANIWMNDQKTEQFKSYYVVWKPIGKAIPIGGGFEV